METGSGNLQDRKPWEFTCTTCGGNQLTVTRVWTILAGPDTQRWQEWGPLKADHTWQFEYKEQVEKNPDDEVDRGDFGAFSEDDSNSEPQDYEIHPGLSSPEEDEIFVNCASCDREIAFGWSQPNRGGLIFPAECSDFIPAQTWPDPRYYDSWVQKGWIKTDKDRHDWV